MENAMMLLNVATALTCLVAGCGQAPTVSVAETAPKGALAQVPSGDAPSPADPANGLPSGPGAAPSPVASASPTPAPIALTYYRDDVSRAPLAFYPAHGYQASGSCVVYEANTYCWDDGMKVLSFTQNGVHVGPFTYSYWNLSQNTVGWAPSGGAMQNDLMESPRIIGVTLQTNLPTGAVQTVFTDGTPIDVSCVLNAGLLDCSDFVIDLNQAQL